MGYLKIGEKVINKRDEVGTITSFDDEYILVDFGYKVSKFKSNAFELGFLKYENEALQIKVNEFLESGSNEVEENKITHTVVPELEKIECDDRLTLSCLRLDAAPISFNLVRKIDKELLQKIFDECDNDTRRLHESLDFKMEYPKYTSQSRSKYCIGILNKYLNTYVFRIFSRNDIYKKRVRTGINILNSDTTEIFRFLRINDKDYCFSKNVSLSNGFFNNSTSYNNWHISELGRGIMLNEIIRVCDCGYLNGYISEYKIDFEPYINLMYPALYNNKVEIVFKNKLFLQAHRIKNISNYLKEFSSKQIDFASKNNVINTLPVIKQFGLYDLDILQQLEEIMKKRRYDSSIYEKLVNTFKTLNFDCSDLYKRIIDFLKRIDRFEPAIYRDYIGLLSRRHGITSRDFFDKDYIARHDVMMNEKQLYYDMEQRNKYASAVKELSWIDREEDGYFIIVPKTIEEFKYEAQIQHNCLYASAYFMDVINKESIIVFLRKEKNIPFVTIEFDYETFDVIQAYGKYNSKLERSLYQYVVNLGKKLYYEKMCN